MVRHPALAGHSGVRDMYYTYILKSEKDGKSYIGQTNNVVQRLAYHNRGKVTATRRRIPLRLSHVEVFKTRKEAMEREKYLKSLKGGNAMQKILSVS